MVRWRVGTVALAFGLLAPALPARAASAPAASPASRPTYSTFHFEEDRVPMRDGVHLDVGIWIPDVPAGVRVPVILTLTPYGILDYTPAPYDGTTLPDDQAKWFVPLGYARAFADVRGTRNSEGCYDYGGPAERHDGYDLVEWLAAQPWSSGRVGMVGTSYEGTTANAAASEHPPHLKAIVPIASINKWYDYAYEAGTRFFLNSEVATDEGIDTPAGFTFGFGIIPPFDAKGSPTNIVTRISPCDRAAQMQHGYNLEPDYDQYWKDRDYLAAEASSGIPTWVVHGLQDNNVRTWEGTEVWEALPPSTPKKLWLGVWPHADGSSRGGTEWQRQMTEWWDRWLMGLDSGVDREPAVDVEFRDSTWHNDSTWPPRGTTSTAFYLHPAGGGVGLLDGRAPASETAETVVDDPSLTENRMLQAPATADPARLTYATVPLTAPLRIAGRPRLDLWASSTQVGTHYALLLCDVDGSGRWTIVHRGFGNARYRNGLYPGQDLTAGQAYEDGIAFFDDDYTFPAGHSVGLVLSSSNAVWALPSEYRSVNTILHTATQASALMLPVVPESSPRSAPPAPSPSPTPRPAVTPMPRLLPNSGAASPAMAAVAGLLALALLGLGLARRRDSGGARGRRR